MTKGLMIAAPNSGAGKTTITLALLRALKNAGFQYTSAKSGPDYIDPRFHEAASGSDCVNLDSWAMQPERIRGLAQGAPHLLIEAAMGLFDGAGVSGRGSAAELAQILNAPIILVLDAAKQSQSIAALVKGFVAHRSDIQIAGLILNKIGSARHEQILRAALRPTGLPILGAIPRDARLELPSRHLGLVQAGEHQDLELFISDAADLISEHVDLEKLHSISAPLSPSKSSARLIPPAQHLAIARDEAFAFTYPHMLADWRAQGAELSFFSPLADQAAPEADLVFLPGGYPELHAGKLASNENFLSSLKSASKVYGECGGYMVMGKTLIDKKGHAHKMAGLLDLVTSFEHPKLHLGYRNLLQKTSFLEGLFAGHEFHFAATIEAHGDPLFSAEDADGNRLPDMGLQSGQFAGSFAHIIDRRP
ncbi:MAG: cobyrinate a,c-diamide synthase [Pseudomonadota bacterium]